MKSYSPLPLDSLLFKITDSFLFHLILTKCLALSWPIVNTKQIYDMNKRMKPAGRIYFFVSYLALRRWNSCGRDILRRKHVCISWFYWHGLSHSLWEFRETLWNCSVSLCREQWESPQKLRQFLWKRKMLGQYTGPKERKTKVPNTEKFSRVSLKENPLRALALSAHDSECHCLPRRQGMKETNNYSISSSAD